MLSCNSCVWHATVLAVASKPGAWQTLFRPELALALLVACRVDFT